MPTRSSTLEAEPVLDVTSDTSDAIDDADVANRDDPDVAHRDDPDVAIRDDEAVATRDLDEVAPAADLMRVYLNEIGRTPLLSAAEEVDLARRIEAGVYAAELLRRHDAGEETLPAKRRRDLTMVAEDGAAAKDHMLRANLRLVVSVAKKFSNRGVPLGDIIQEGNVGLVRAVEKFDYAKGFKFSTYAMWWIRQSIGRGLPELARTIRLPVHVNEEVAKVARARRELLSTLNRSPEFDEIAELTGLTTERVSELSRLGRDPISLDATVGDQDDTVFGDLLVDTGGVTTEDTVEHRAMVGQLHEVVDRLPEREATIVRLRFGLHDGKPHTLDEIGRELGLTRERIRQLEKLALSKLRHPSVTQEMLDWAS